MQISTNPKPEGFYQGLFDDILSESGKYNVALESMYRFKITTKMMDTLAVYGIEHIRDTVFMRNGIRCKCGSRGRADIQLINSNNDQFLIELKSNYGYFNSTEPDQLIKYIIGTILNDGVAPKHVKLIFISTEASLVSDYDLGEIKAKMCEVLTLVDKFSEGMGVSITGSIIIIKKNYDELTLPVILGNKAQVYPTK